MRPTLAVMLAVAWMAAPNSPAAPQPKDDGYRGIWHYNQATKEEYKYKYSGGMATYPQQHIPIAIYSPRNHTYARRPVNAHPDFYAIWADGHGRQPSESHLYFTNQRGDHVWRLPQKMTTDFAAPEIAW